MPFLNMVPEGGPLGPQGPPGRQTMFTTMVVETDFVGIEEEEEERDFFPESWVWSLLHAK